MVTKILVNQTAFLGDLLLSTPLLKQLRKQFPDAQIYLVCRKGLGSTMKELKLVDHFFEIAKGEAKSYRKTLFEISGIRFDLVLSPHESFRSATFISRIQANKKIGFKKWWNFLFYDFRVQKNFSQPEAIRQLSLLMPIWPELKEKIKTISPIPDWASMVVPLPLEIKTLRERWNIKSDHVCLFPGSVWGTKKWTREGYRKTGQHFSEKGKLVLIMGGKGEEELCEGIAGQINGAISLAGKTSLLETAAILSEAQIVVTNDSGGQHLAALSGAPTVAIFGPTIPEFGFIPWNKKSVIVETKGLNCRPCGKHGPQICPIGTHECMTRIQAEEVISKAEGLMKQAFN
jgi:heptosyltransferase II